MKLLPEAVKHEIEIVSRVLPFKANNYVVDYLIDWANYETDPCYIPWLTAELHAAIIYAIVMKLL